MNILVFSDSHRRHEPIRKLLDIYAGEVKLALHLGDHTNDLLRYEHEYPNYEFRGVAGNCDFGAVSPKELLMSVYGRGILLMHGHTRQVKSNYDRIAYYAEEKGVNACLFGHTHKPALFERGPVLFFNPGSVSEPRGGDKASYGILSVSEQGVIKGKVLYL
jgi:hypothetical protein